MSKAGSGSGDALRTSAGPLAFALMLLGNWVLAAGPWLVRMADVGPVATGFWRLTLALPFLWLIAKGTGQQPHWPKRPLLLAVLVNTKILLLQINDILTLAIDYAERNRNQIG